jgi:AraC-like DNA-binding protein
LRLDIAGGICYIFLISKGGGQMQIPSYVKTAIEMLNKSGYECYLVGGCVRDMLMGKIPHDFDITTDAFPSETSESFPDCDIILTGLKHGTVTVVYEGENIEITTFRTDGEYLDNRHPKNVTFVRNISEDLSRRDFTVNAMAYNPDEGLIDLFDGGVQYSLKPGDCFIIPPNVPSDFIYRINNGKNQSLGYYVHFIGTVAKEMMESFDANKITVLRNVSSDVSRLFESLFYSNRTGRRLAAIGNLLRIVSALSDKANSLSTETEKMVRREADYINKHYTEEIDFDAMAARCNLSRSRFTHVFSDVFGVPPTQYRQNLRIELSSELLRFSELTIAEVAQRCGFRDPLYFSRVFRKVTGISPTEYREQE